MTTRALAALALVALSVSTAAQAQQPTPAPPAAQAPAPPPQYPIVRVGVLSYLQYDAELKNRQGFNNFDVTRAYLNINGQLTDNIRFRFTPDIRRATDGNLAGSLVVRVKYAFAQFDNITPRGWIRFGLHQTPWLDFEESVNRYRVQGQMFSEREGLIPGSADFGVSYFTPLPNGYGEVHAGVYNGEGFGNAEVNKQKSVQGRLTVRPFPNASIAKAFRVSGFYNAGWYAADRPRRLGIVMGSFEHNNLVATAEIVRATENPLTLVTPRDIDRNGWSVFLEPRQGPTGFAGIFRYDSLDPDDSLTVNEQNRVIAGAAYWLTVQRGRVGFVLTNEQVHYDDPARLDENRILVQTHIEF
jgi:hypothetical protein